MTKVSIIVPVYNVEKYLARCLDSCINQSFSDIEIICVNDGSTDRSLEILEAYARMDSRIKIINKENGGLSSARNVGVEAAQGEYILYVDSDDYISSTAVKALYENALANQSDVVIFDYYWLRQKASERMVLTIKAFGVKFVNTAFNADSLSKDDYKYVQVAAWLKLYRTELLKSNSITFDEGLIYEDVSYWAKVFVNAKRITYLPQPFYAYSYGRTDQIMQRDDEKVFDVIKVSEIVENTFKQAGYYEKYKHAVDIMMIIHYLQKLSLVKPELKVEFYNAVKALNKDIDYDYFEQESGVDFERFSARTFRLLNSSNSYEEFEELRKGVSNGK